MHTVSATYEGNNIRKLSENLPLDIGETVSVLIHTGPTVVEWTSAVATSPAFDFLKDAIKKMPDADLEKPVTFFGQETNVRGMLLTALSHMHEHLGQSIAYARMNNIVPPWTVAQQAAEAKEKKN